MDLVLINNIFVIILRVARNSKMKYNTDLDDYTCCFCLNEIVDDDVVIYICPNCKKCFCLYDNNVCRGFFKYMSYGWLTCPMCKVEI
jgi:hypothetical protein